MGEALVAVLVLAILAFVVCGFIWFLDQRSKKVREDDLELRERENSLLDEQLGKSPRDKGK